MNIDTLFRGGLALIPVLFLSLPLSAQNSGQEGATQSDSSLTLTLEEIVVSANRWEEPASTAGRNVSVISSEEIENAVYDNVGELLADEQNVHLIGARQTPGSLQTMFLRNANGNHSVVMVDGVRISDPSTNNNSIDLAELSLAGVERIEIVRGAHSTLYGSSAIGGVVNIITRESEEEGLGGSLQTGHGTFGSGTYRTSNNLNTGYRSKNGFFMNIGIDQRYTRGMDATVDTVSNPDVFNPQDRDDFSKIDLSGKAGYTSDRWDLFASWRRAGQRSDVDAGAFNDDDNAYVDFNRNLLSYGVSYAPSEYIEVSLNGAYSDLTRDFVNDSSVVDAAGNYDGSYNETNGEGTLFENELTAHYQQDHWSLITGVGSVEQTMNIRSYTFDRPSGFESVTDLDSLDLTETISHAFLKTELEGGMVDESLQNFVLGIGTRFSHHDEFGSYSTYEINPQYHFESGSMLYGALTTGFNAPSLYQLHSPEMGGPVTNRGNNSLAPETSVSYEAGWKQTVGDFLRFELALFNTEVSDVVEYVYLWNGEVLPEELSFEDYLGDTYLNLSRQNTYGIEAGLNAQLSSRWSINGHLTYSRSTLEFDPGEVDNEYTGGNHVQVYESGVFMSDNTEMEGLTRRPSFSGKVGLQYRPLPDLRLGTDTRFIGNQDDIYYSAALGPFGALDRSEVGRYTLTDLAAHYHISDRFTASVKVENIFNTDYTEIDGFSTRGRSLFTKLKFNL